jgi:hypothetical protein
MRFSTGGRAWVVVVAIATAVLAQSVRAQTGQKLSVQASGLYADLYGDQFKTFKAGYGVEVQLRYTPSALSLGAGVQYTQHGDSEAERDGHHADVDLVGFFIEPRYVLDVGSDRAAPYISGRAAFGRFDVQVDFSTGEVLTFDSNGLTLNGGGGVLIRLTPRVNLDLGLTLGFSRYQDTTGYVDGTPYDQPGGSGLNAVARVGLAIGIGK